MRKQIILLSFFSSCISLLYAQTDVTEKIKKEGLSNSKVMEMAFHLTDVSGPRLTNSPGFFRAANWAKDEMTKKIILQSQSKWRKILLRFQNKNDCGCCSRS